ncbi:hypothetical protein ACLKA7_004261 [Drosophila subpalustris]
MCRRTTGRQDKPGSRLETTTLLTMRLPQTQTQTLPQPSSPVHATSMDKARSELTDVRCTLPAEIEMCIDDCTA